MHRAAVSFIVRSHFVLFRLVGDVRPLFLIIPRAGRAVLLVDVLVLFHLVCWCSKSHVFGYSFRYVSVVLYIFSYVDFKKVKEYN